MWKGTHNTRIFNQEQKETTHTKKENHHALNRRDFLKIVVISTPTTARPLSETNSNSRLTADSGDSTPIPTDHMTDRTTPSPKDKVSNRGYECMRLPSI